VEELSQSRVLFFRAEGLARNDELAIECTHRNPHRNPKRPLNFSSVFPKGARSALRSADATWGNIIRSSSVMGERNGEDMPVTHDKMKCRTVVWPRYFQQRHLWAQGIEAERPGWTARPG
jgi:hypothetical protein